MKIKIMALLLLYAVTEPGCRKEKDDDYIVYDGNVAFGAFLNGKPYKADYRDAGWNIGPVSVSMMYSTSGQYRYLTVGGRKKDSHISFFIGPPLMKGRKLVNAAPYYAGRGVSGLYSDYLNNKVFMTDSTATGFVDFLLCDTIKGRFEGYFEFVAKHYPTDEKATITKGYFKKGD